MKNLNEDIKTGNFRQTYLLYGEEDYLKNQYKNRLKKAILPGDDTMNFSLYTGKGIDIRQMIDQAETLPFFAEHRLILVEQSGFFKNACAELAEYLPQMPKETIIIFVENEVDKRGKMFKAVKQNGRVVELARQDERTLQSWILGMLKKEQKNITGDALRLFMEKTGDDMENIANELEKLLSYTHGKAAIEPGDVEEICTVTTESRIFDMIRALAEKRQKEALDLYYDLLSLKEPPMRILFLIARQFNQMLQLKDLREQGLDSAAIASRAGVAPFIAKRSLAQAGRFEKQELRQAVEDCVAAEEAVKTGRLGDRLAVEMLIVKYSQ
ncbi:MAG: DNA polymerase III subunit delta [Lachnospiraceae bacterium]|nr:DNA polymerase III subunit delta [Lachnospiraceae bacterium]